VIHEHLFGQGSAGGGRVWQVVGGELKQLLACVVDKIVAGLLPADPLSMSSWEYVVLTARVAQA
jgi:hypothetical protein